MHSDHNVIEYIFDSSLLLRSALHCVPPACLQRVRCGSMRAQTGRAKASTCPYWPDKLVFPCLKPPDVLVLEVLKCEPRRHTRYEGGVSLNELMLLPVLAVIMDVLCCHRVDVIATCTIATDSLSDSSSGDSQSLERWVCLSADESTADSQTQRGSASPPAAPGGGSSGGESVATVSIHSNSAGTDPAGIAAGTRTVLADGASRGGGTVAGAGQRMQIHACVEWMRVSHNV